MEFVQAIKSSKLEHWYEAFQWLVWNVIGGLMPIWLPIIILYSFRQQIGLHILTDHGEFALYSASFLGTALYVVLKDLNKVGFPNRSIITIILTILLILSSTLFSLVSLTDVLLKIGINKPAELLYKEFLRSTNTGLLILVCFISLLIFVVDLVRAMPDLVGERNQQFKNFSDQFDNIKES